MAVVLDINNTQHLSYSPLNEKHNILYNNARRSFSQRYKQKPWFRLNPFTDKDVGKGENLDSYDPGFDAGISPLQSLVIVEDYASDTPQFTKEFKISEFWDFLFSDSWSSGYAVRVFEGQLLDLMVTCLISLTRTGSVVGHATKAFATNKRQKVTVVQKAKSLETEVVPFIETLLLRFIYYGHTVKPVCFDSESSIGYPDITSATTTDSSCIRETTDSFSSEHGSVYHNVSPSKLLPILAADSQCKNPRVARIRASKYARNQYEEERAIITRFLSSNNKGFLPCPPPIPRGKSYGYTCSNFSNASDDYKTLPPRDNLTNLLCTEKVSYLGEFTLPEDSDSSSEEDGYEDAEDFGQNFYIGDTDGLLRKDEVETSELILKRKKAALKERRDERKRELSKVKPKETQIMPEFSELDISKYVKEEELRTHVGLSESDRMPTFEEYAEMLEDELKREARLRAKNAIKLLFSKLKEESVGDKKGKISSIPAHGLWKMGTPRITKLLHKKCQKVDKKKAIPKRTNEIVVPLVYISTASGMTYLHPVSKQLFLVKRVEEEKERAKELKKHFSRRTSLLPTAPTALVNELQKARQSSTTSLNQSDSLKLGEPQFPKIKLVQSEIESPDDSDDSEDDNDLDQRLFDAKKLNIRYSTDRMRQAKARRRAEERKEEPHFKVILKKYIHMQAVLSAFSKTPKRPRRSSVAGITRVKSKKHKKSAQSTLSTCAAKDSVEVDQFVDVGKLKWFSFLEAKDKENLKSAEQIGAFFDYYPMELFRENLERALKDFVVRREIIFSDYNNKSLVSITFTKKSVFTTSKFS